MYAIVLYLHLLIVVIAAFAMGIMMYATSQLRSAGDVRSALRSLNATNATSKTMGPISLLLLASGAYLTQQRWTWSSPWVDLGIAGLVLLSGIGAGVLGGRERSLHRALTQAQGNAIDANLARQLDDSMLLVVSGVNVGIVFGIMYVMVTKPPLLPGIAALIVGAAAGAFVLSLIARPRRERTVSATE